MRLKLIVSGKWGRVGLIEIVFWKIFLECKEL